MTELFKEMNKENVLQQPIATIVSISSELANNPGQHLLTGNRSEVWLSDAGLP